MSTLSDTSSVFVAPGVLASFAEHLALSSDQALPAIKTQVTELVGVYANQGVKTFWSPADLAVAHVVIGNHLLNGVDSNQLISDVENFEVVFSGIQELFTVFVTERRRSVFNETVTRYMELPPIQKSALEGALNLAISTLDEAADSKQLVSADDRSLYHIAQKVKEQQPQPGWARLRLELVLSVLQGNAELPAAPVVPASHKQQPVSAPVPDTAVAIRAATM